MHFHGQELISRGTKVASRTLTTACIAKLFIYYAGLQTGTADIAGLKVPVERLADAGSAILIFLLVSHLVSWSGDLISYRNWNSAKKVTSGRWDDTGSQLYPEIAVILEHLDHLNDALKTDHTLTKSLIQKGEQLTLISEDLRKIRSGLGRLNLYAQFVLFGWYLAIPILLAFFAIGFPELVGCLPGANAS